MRNMNNFTFIKINFYFLYLQFGWFNLLSNLKVTILHLAPLNFYDILILKQV